MELNRKNMRKLMLLITFGIVLCLALLNLYRLPGAFGSAVNVLKPVIFGFVVAYVFNLLLRRIETHLFAPLNRRFTVRWPRARRPLGILLTFLIIFGALALFMLIIMPDLTSSISTLVTEIPLMLGRLQSGYNGLLAKFPALARYLSGVRINWDSIRALFAEPARKFTSNALGYTVTLTTSVFNAFVSFTLGFVISVNILYKKETLKRQAHKLISAYLPGRAPRRTVYLLRLANKAFSDFITGQCLGGLILGALCFVGMEIFRFPFALLISVVVALMSLVPILGQILSVVIGALLILLVNPSQSFWFIVYLLVLQQLNGNLIYPKIVGSKIGLPSLWVLIAITVGGNLFGIVGMLVSIPLFSVAHTLIKEDVARRLARKQAQADAARRDGPAGNGGPSKTNSAGPPPRP